MTQSETGAQPLIDNNRDNFQNNRDLLLNPSVHYQSSISSLHAFDFGIMALRIVARRHLASLAACSSARAAHRSFASASSGSNLAESVKQSINVSIRPGLI